MLTFYGEELQAPTPNPKAEEQTLAGCRQLLSQYIRTYSPYIEAFSFMEYKKEIAK
jgi:hypothetical protein